MIITDIVDDNVEIRKCLSCGHEFMAYKETDKKYCCKQCKNKHEMAVRERKGYKIRKCVVCGAEFVSIRTRLACSKECEDAHNKTIKRTFNKRRTPAQSVSIKLGKKIVDYDEVQPESYM